MTDTQQTPAGDPDDAVIRVRDLVNAFGANVVHNGLDLDVRRGEILGVVGGSGSGKSVLLRSIVGLQKIRSGVIELFGEPLGEMLDDSDNLCDLRLGVMFQDGALFSSLTVTENIQLAIKEHYKVGDALLQDLADMKMLLAELPLKAANQYPSELSGGMRKRAGLARALALDPEILFLDEPTAGLDPISAAAIDRLLQTLRDALGLTVFLVTHDLDTLHAICDRVAVLGEGRLITIGTLDEVANFDHPWIKAYFSGPRGRRGQVDRGDTSDTGL
ncbi:MAG: ATP-binding cassette domain-containing protein [Gammaproteobacteria bacterium]|nr:ATP-binding cassette domain-containing protein [Gammaproteobacteria bacterium]